MHLPNIVVMGVAGCGKSSVGMALAEALRATSIEGDSFHPENNIARMAAGIPLSDADRADWLGALRARLAQGVAQGERMVLACSALKRAYRDHLREGDPDLYFVHLAGNRELIAERMSRRAGHYMPLSLLDSQFADLEAPQPDERSFTCALGAGDHATPEQLCHRVLEHLQRDTAPGSF